MQRGLWMGQGALVALVIALVATFIGWVTWNDRHVAHAAGPEGMASSGESDLALVPPDANWVLTLRPADLSRKLELKDQPESFPWYTTWRRQFGIELSEVEHCTLVGTMANNDVGPNCLIVRTVKPYKRQDVLKAFAPDAREVTYRGLVCHIGRKTTAAVHFADAHTLVLGSDEQAVVACLKQAKVSDPAKKSFADHRERLGKHDLAVWVRTLPANGGPWSSRPTTSCSHAWRPPVQTALKPRWKVGPSKSPELPPVMLGFFPFPLPAGVEAGSVMMDVGDELAVEVRLHCADAASATKAAEALSSLVSVVRGALLMPLAELDMAKLYQMPEGQEMPGVPTALLRQTEKALQNVQVQPRESDVLVAVRVPMNGKKVGSEIEAVVRLLGGPYGCGGNYVCQPLLPVKVVGEPIPMNPVSPGMVPMQATTSPYGVPPAPPYPCPPPAVAYVMPPSCPQPVQAVATGCGVAPASCPSASPTTPLPPPPPEPTRPSGPPVKLTVANVKPEPAWLFTLTEGSKLDFVKKVGAGDAVDVNTVAGQRWVAIFTENPASQTFVPSQAEAIWLLRSPTQEGASNGTGCVPTLSR